MTQETAWLDYTKPPPWYAVEEDAADPPSGKWGAYLRDDADHETLWESEWTTRDLALAAAWAHYKTEHDPPGLQVQSFRARALGLPDPEARATAWEWYNRRRAVVLDIDDQTCSKGRELAAWLSAALAWTDAECAEVEAYAALTFPRSVDMPAPLQRVLLPEGPA